MEGPRALFGLVMLVGGALGVRYAHVITRFNEQLDAIGSTRDLGEVEPADWNVAITMLVAAGFALVGLFVLISAIV